MNGIKTLENGVEVIVDLIDDGVDAIFKYPRNFIEYMAIRKIAKKHRKQKAIEDIERDIATRISVRSHMINSMNDFNNKNKCSSMAMDSIGRFRRVR